MILEEIKLVAEILSNVALVIGITVGGVWSYFRYVKDRLFAVRVEVSLKHSILAEDENAKAMVLELCVRNIGSVLVRPENYTLEHEGYRLMNGETTHTYPRKSVQLLPRREGLTWYIEPNETDYRSIVVVLPQQTDFVSIQTIVHYNRRSTTTRSFSVPTKKEKSIIETDDIQ